MAIDTKNPWVPIIAGIIFLMAIAYMTWEYETKRRTREHFVNTLAMNNDVTSFTKERTKVFVQKGLYAFFCSSANVTYATQNLDKIARFVPHHIDYYCRLQGVERGERCDNMFIDFFSSRDNYVYSLNDEVCNTINTTIENKDPELSHFRIQNTIYTLQKRCTMFENLQVSYVNGDGTYTVKFTDPAIGDGIRKLSSFILCRPMFLSLNSYGLYQIMYDKNRNNAGQNANNMFISMSSEDRLDEKFMYLRRVTQGANDRPLIHHTSALSNSDMKDITSFFKESLANQGGRDKTDVNIVRSSRIPMTMFYLNYVSSFDGDDKTNVFTFIVDHNLVRRLKERPNERLNITGAISGMSDSIAMVYHSIRVESDPNDTVRIQYNGAGIPDWWTMELPAKFKARLSSLNSYHIAVCCAYDTYTMCAFAGDDFYYSRNELVSNANASAAGFAFSRTAIESALSNFKELQLNSAPGMINSFRYDSIPNFALLARYLGYNV